MTEEEFMKGLKTLLQFYPKFTLETTNSEGDIVLKRKEPPTGKLARWVLLLQEYHFTVVHRRVVFFSQLQEKGVSYFPRIHLYVSR